MTSPVGIHAADSCRVAEPLPDLAVEGLDVDVAFAYPAHVGIWADEQCRRRAQGFREPDWHARDDVNRCRRVVQLAEPVVAGEVEGEEVSGPEELPDRDDAVRPL